MLDKKNHDDNIDNQARMVTDEDLKEVYLKNDDKEKDTSVKKNVSGKKSNENKIKSSDKNDNFNFRFFLCAFLVILFSFLAAYFLKRSFSLVGEQNITYQENSNIDYKVYLKDNDFYEEKFLKKDMVYVASLIDKIDVDFDYTFKIDRKSNIDFEYDIIGKLVISDTSKKSTFFEKDYVLLESTRDNMTKNGLHHIAKNISIDYAKYNSLANQFRSKYGVETNSRLIVYLNIYEKSDKNNSFNLNNASNMSLTIPLSERAINIAMDYNEVNKTSKLVRNEEFVISNYLYVALGSLFLILFIIVFVKFMKLILSVRVKKSKYDKYVSRLLREYDRLIVETVTSPDFEGKNVINLLKFQELLDVRDNLKLPIKYYVVKNHSKSYFYINQGAELYLFVVKYEDFLEKQ